MSMKAMNYIVAGVHRCILRAATDDLRQCEYHLYPPRTGEVDPFFWPEPSYTGGPSSKVAVRRVARVVVQEAIASSPRLEYIHCLECGKPLVRTIAKVPS